MKVIEKQADSVLIRYMEITYRFSENIVVSDRIVYQLPCTIGKKSFGLKAINKHWHQGENKYYINSKRISCNKFNSLLIKSKDLIEIDRERIIPF